MVDEVTAARIGMVLAERYRIIGWIASGGMGDVWRGRDELLDRDVAIKVLRPEHADDKVFRARLRAEARAAAAIGSPAAIDIYDFGEQRDPDGRCVSFLVMELVVGEPLSDLLSREGTLGADRTVTVIGQSALGLAAAHRRGLVHRDVKPANLLLGDAGEVKVADFGIARAADSAALTATGVVLGTARYLAPEQVEGRPATSASDVYSLGVVAHHCLTGRPPFSGDGEIATALARLRIPPPPLPTDVPPDLRDVVMSMLDREPARRPTAADVARRLGVPAATMTTATTAAATTTAAAVTTALPAAAHPPTAPLAPGAGRTGPGRSRLSVRTALLVGAGAVVLAAVVGVLAAANGPGSAAPSRTATSPSATPSTSRVARSAATPSSVSAHRTAGRPGHTAATTAGTTPVAATAGTPSAHQQPGHGSTAPTPHAALKTGKAPHPHKAPRPGKAPKPHHVPKPHQVR
jgi:serine/threonine-protein kinase